MEINRTSNKKIFIKESLDYYTENFLDIQIGYWEQAIEKIDHLHTRASVSTQDVENLEMGFGEFLKDPKNLYKRGQLIGFLGKVLDPCNHSLLFNGKKIKLTYLHLILKSDFPLKVVAGAVIGFFCKEFQVNTNKQK